jgi:DNA-directed RNA polymerase subunit D
MKAEIKSESENRMEFVLKDASPSFVNMIRRFAMSQVPVFAIDKVTVYENTSALFDEYIANRIGLVPIRTAGSFKPDEEIVFTLDASGPCTVYSKDLKSTDSKIKAANQNILLLKLMENESLRLEGRAKLGKGRQHAKFQAGLVSYAIDGNSFHVSAESFSQVPVREMLVKAAGMVEQKCDEMEESLDALERSLKKKKE